MNRIARLILIALLLAVACSKSEDIYLTESPDFGADQAIFSDDELTQAAYSAYTGPSDFYHEHLEGTALAYVSQGMLAPTSSGTTVELCTNEQTEAELWAGETDIANNEKYSTKSVSENEKFFQINRINKTYSNDVVIVRVHKCSFIDRSMYNKKVGEGKIAVLQQMTDDMSEIKQYIEYLWLIDNVGRKALSSVIRSDNDRFYQDIFEVEVERGDAGTYDKIHLYKNSYEVSKTDGSTSKSRSIIKTIDGKLR